VVPVPARCRMAARGVEVNGATTLELPNPVVTGAVEASAPISATERPGPVVRGSTAPL